MQRKRKLSQKT